MHGARGDRAAILFYYYLFIFYSPSDYWTDSTIHQHVSQARLFYLASILLRAYSTFGEMGVCVLILVACMIHCVNQMSWHYDT